MRTGMSWCHVTLGRQLSNRRVGRSKGRELLGAISSEHKKEKRRRKSVQHYK